MRTAIGSCALLLLSGLTACLQPSAVTCADGSLCAAGLACDPTLGCVDPAVLAGCVDRAEATPCTGGGITDGVCHDGRCVAAGCGNGVLEPLEACDDGNRTPGDGCGATCGSDERCGNGVVDYDRGEICDCGDGTGALPPSCAQANGDAGGASCFTDCQPHRCGDGLLEGFEECEGTDVGDATCLDVGFYGGDLGCSAACRFDTTACVGTCGDDIINGPEACEGYVPTSCVEYGFDYGRPACNDVCGIQLPACGSMKTTVVYAAPDGTGGFAVAWGGGDRAFLAGYVFQCRMFCASTSSWAAYDGAWTQNGLGDHVIALSGVDADHVYARLDPGAIAMPVPVLARATPTGAELLGVLDLTGALTAIHSTAPDRVLLGTSTGQVAWWDAAEVTPWRAADGNPVRLVVDAGAAAFAYVDGVGWQAVDAGGATPLAWPLDIGTAQLVDAGDVFIGDQQGRVAQIDGADATIIADLPWPVTQLLRDRDGSVLAVAGDALFHIVHGLVTQVATGGAGVRAAFVTDGEVHITDGTVVRRLAPTRVETSVGTWPAGAMAAGATGLWTVVDGDVQRGDATMAFPGAYARDVAVAGDDAFVLDDAGAVWRWRAGAWTDLELMLDAVGQVGWQPTKLWAAPDGALVAAAPRRVYRRGAAAGAWTSDDLANSTMAQVLGVSGRSATDVYVVVRDGEPPWVYRADHFDGATWTEVAVPAINMPFVLTPLTDGTLLFTPGGGVTSALTVDGWAPAWPEVTTPPVEDPLTGHLFATSLDNTAQLLERDAFGWLPVRDMTTSNYEARPVIGPDGVMVRYQAGGVRVWRR